MCLTPPSQSSGGRSCHDHPLHFLFGAYHQRVYWFEVFEVFRRIALSGALVLLGSGSIVQSAFSILICLFSITVYSVYEPLGDPENNVLQWIAQIQLFLVLLTILLMRAAQFETEATQDDKEYLGFLLVFITIPGYCLMMFAVSVWEGDSFRRARSVRANRDFLALEF